MQVAKSTGVLSALDVGKVVEHKTEHVVMIRPEGSTRAEIALQGVYEISKVLASPARLEIILSNVLRLLSSFLDMHHGLIAILDDEGAPGVVVGLGWENGLAREHFNRLPELAVGQIITTKMPLVTENAAGHPLFSGWIEQEWGRPEAGVSFAGVPIIVGDCVIGAMTMDRSRADYSESALDRDVRYLAMIANLVGQTVRLHDVVGRDRERLMSERSRLEKELSSKPKIDRDAGLQHIVGNGPAIRAVIEKIAVVARSHSTVLLRGESGTGKELFARATHDLSLRKNGPFIKLNCAALSESVLESELFGHEKGSFTGALSQRKGRFELAHGGTLFLDEIGEISASFQAKLLRVLQEGEFERVGGMKTLKVDVRLVTATNRNLEDAVTRGDFRADLYYRINVVSIQLPALRDRPEDIVPLSQEFLRRFNDEHATQKYLTASARELLQVCYFPGNVRELENCIRRTATMARESRIVGDDFACHNNECLSSTLWRGLSTPAAKLNTAARIIEVPPSSPSAPMPAAARASRPVDAEVEDEDCALIEPEHCPQIDACKMLMGEGRLEKDSLLRAMESAGWVQAKAARLLKLTPRQIGYALKKHDIPIRKF